MGKERGRERGKGQGGERQRTRRIKEAGSGGERGRKREGQERAGGEQVPAARKGEGRGDVRKEPVSLHTASKTEAHRGTSLHVGTFQQPPSWGVPEPLCSHGPPNKGGFNPLVAQLRECYYLKYRSEECPAAVRGSKGPYMAAGPSSIIRRTSLNIQSTACVVPGTKSLGMVYTVLHLYYTVLALLHV